MTINALCLCLSGCIPKIIFFTNRFLTLPGFFEIVPEDLLYYILNRFNNKEFASISILWV